MIKKSIIVLAITLIALFGAKFSYDYYQDNYSKMSDVSVEEITTIDEMNRVLEENETVYVYVGRPNCGDSDDFEEYFVSMMEDNNIDNLYYFNIKSITDEYSENKEYKEMLDEEFGVMYTPTLAKFENGELVLKSEWTPATGYNQKMAEDFLEESGILND